MSANAGCRWWPAVACGVPCRPLGSPGAAALDTGAMTMKTLVEAVTRLRLWGYLLVVGLWLAVLRLFVGDRGKGADGDHRGPFP